MATRRDASPKGRTATTSNAPPTNRLSSTRPTAGTTSVHDVRKQAPVKKPTTTVATARKTIDKAPIPAKPSLHSRETPHLPTRKTPAPTAPIPSRLKTPSPRKTQASTNPTHQSHVKTAPAPAPAPRKPSPDKTPVPARKTQAPSPGKSIASQKTALGKKLKALLHRPASKTSNAEVITAPKTEQPTSQENDENLIIYQNLPEVETLPEDQEVDTFFLQQDINIEPEEHDQEKPLVIAEIEAEKIVIPIEPSPAPVDVRTEEPEEKLLVEEKPEEHSVGSDYHGEEDDEKKVEVVEKGEVVDHSEAHEDNEKDEVIEKVEVAEHSEAHVHEETKEPEVVAEKQAQEPEKKVQKQGFAVRKESVVSNSAIEETASKLRGQRISRVRALAGAFESVMQ